VRWLLTLLRSVVRAYHQPAVGHPVDVLRTVRLRRVDRDEQGAQPVDAGVVTDQLLADLAGLHALAERVADVAGDVDADCVSPKPMPCWCRAAKNWSSGVPAVAVPPQNRPARPSVAAASAVPKTRLAVDSMRWIGRTGDQASRRGLYGSAEILV
jgi:hypothetical protein